jgi:hypothetical protein
VNSARSAGCRQAPRRVAQSSVPYLPTSSMIFPTCAPDSIRACVPAANGNTL